MNEWIYLFTHSYWMFNLNHSASNWGHNDGCKRHWCFHTEGGYSSLEYTDEWTDHCNVVWGAKCRKRGVQGAEKPRRATYMAYSWLVVLVRYVLLEMGRREFFTSLSPEMCLLSTVLSLKGTEHLYKFCIISGFEDFKNICIFLKQKIGSSMYFSFWKFQRGV